MQFKTDGQKIGPNMANLFSIKPTDALSSKFYFGNPNLHVSGSFPAHHQELSTVQSALTHFMQV
jgi:hypothetical protein